MKFKYLIVDDEPQIRRFLQLGLEASGYETLQAGDGAEALRLCAAMAPDLAVLDLGLPDMDGKQVLARLRQWSALPVIVLSARDDEREKIEALDLGGNDYVAKPTGAGHVNDALNLLRRELIPKLMTWGMKPKRAPIRSGRAPCA